MKKVIITILIITFSFAFFIPGTIYAAEFIFTDVKSNDWYFDVLDEVFGRGIIVGYPDNTFKPNNNISRAEFTKTIRVALELDVVEGNSFVDTTAHWAKDEINTAVENFIIDKSDYGYIFEPNKIITRIEMAKMVVRALELNDEAVEKAGEITSFLDDSAIEDADKGYVVIATEKGIINGYTDRTFKPNGNATRAEAAQMLVNMLKVIESKDGQEETQEDIIERVNDTLQERDTKIVLPNGVDSAAKYEEPETYEELIENIETLKVYNYTTRKSNDWELIALSQFVSNQDDYRSTVNTIGAVRMMLPSYKMELSTVDYNGKSYNTVACKSLKDDGFTKGILIKDGEAIDVVADVGTYYSMGTGDNLFVADYIGFTRAAYEMYSNNSVYNNKGENILVVFENPFKK